MEIKLFGKKLFEFNSSNGGGLPTISFISAHEILEKSDHLIDFYKDIGLGMSSTFAEYSVISNHGCFYRSPCFC